MYVSQEELMLRGGRMKNSLESEEVAAKKKKKVREGESGEGRTASNAGGSSRVVNIKRGAAASSSKLPVPGSANCTKKTATIPTPQRHRRAHSSLQLEENANAAKQRTLRQSASFPHGGIAKPPSRHLNHQASVPLTISASRRRILAPHTIDLEDDGHQSDQNVQVFIRARPVSDAEIAQQGRSRCVRQDNAHTVAWLGQPEARFTFDHVADESVTQEELFQVAGLPMVDNCMAGYNSCMFAYGQTGSGKTHTMLGDLGDCENRGMTPRVFEYLFAKIRKEEEAQAERPGKVKYKCRCSFLEIYNEQISDLLEPSSSNLPMREDGKKGVYVDGLLEVEVHTVQDVLHLLLLGATNRKVAATHMNRESSRSHSVFTCVIESQWECDSMVNFRFGRLNLVDLAGSERQKDTGVDEERLREAASINKSLSTLGLVIMVLVDIANGKQRHIPYRDSKLTFLLQDSLGGNSKTTIIANISPSSCASLETLSTLKFAQRAKFIQNNAVINEEASGDVKGLQEQIQQLKGELALVRRQSIGRAVEPSPTVLNHKIKAMEALLVGVLRREKTLVKTSAAEIEHLALLVKQREDETYFHKSQEPEIIRSESCDAELEGSGVDPSESELIMPNQLCNNVDHMKVAVEKIHLQSRLHRCQEYDACEESETVVQDLRNKLLHMLDTNLSMDTAAALLQQEALVAELASARQATDQLQNKFESCQRDLSECQLNLLDSNKRLASELEALRMDLDISRDECNKHKQELEALQLKKASEVDCWEVEQAQHQQFVLELKTQLQKSEEKVEQETMKRSQIELQLQEALQESTNLQTELQWTKDSLEEVEAAVETFQRSEPGCQEIGDSEAAYEAFMVGQLQAEIIEMHARLETERKHRKELEDQINRTILQESLNKTKKNQKNTSSTCKGKRKVRHQDAILQLQLELDSLQPIKSDEIDALKIAQQAKAQWEDLIQAENENLKKELSEWEQAALNMFNHLLEKEDTVIKERLLQAQELAHLGDKKLHAMRDLMFKYMGRWQDMESALQSYQNMKGNLEACYKKLQEVGQKSALISSMERWMSETATLRHEITWEGKKKQFGDEKELLEIQVQSTIDLLGNILAELGTTKAQLQQVIDMSTEEIVKKQQALITEVEHRHIDVKELELAGRVNLEQDLEAAHLRVTDLQHQIELKEEEIVKLKEQAAQEHWVQEKAETIRECMEETQTMQTLNPKRKYSETVMALTLGNNNNSPTGFELMRMEDARSHLTIAQSKEFDVFTEEKSWQIITTSKSTVVQGFPARALTASDSGKVKLLTGSRRSREEQELKALVISLDAENAHLQHQLLETEADCTALKSSIRTLQRELQAQQEEVAETLNQLHVSDRHVFKLECQSVELRDAMQRQAVAFGVLYEQFQNHESLQLLQEERDNAHRYQEESRQLRSQVESLQQELQPLQNERALIYEELHGLRIGAAMAAQEAEEMRTRVEDLERKRAQLQHKVKRKQSAIEGLEKRLVVAQQLKAELHVCKEMAKCKQVEVDILAKSVEELENTVYALESQVGLLKREGDRQHLLREDMENELQLLKHQNATLTEASGRESRKLEVKKLEKHQMGSHKNDSFPQPKGKKTKALKGSAFRCFNMNHQVHSELNEERKSYERRIVELELVLENRQHEIAVLKQKLEDAERITRDLTSVADKEVEHMTSQLNAFIEERESWLEFISQKQGTQAAMEKLSESEKAFIVENKKFKNENRMQPKKIAKLEQEIDTLKCHVKCKTPHGAI